MEAFLFILTNNIIPIFTLIIIGYVMSKKFELDIFTLTKLNFYIFVPSFTFVNIYTSTIHLDMIKVVLVATLLLFINMLLVWLISRVRGYSEGLKNAFSNSVLFYNAGNIGIPLITVIFSSEPFIINGETPYLTVALTAQVMVLVVQNITTNTLGFINAGRSHIHWKACMLKVLKMPTIYAIPLALLFKALPYDLTQLPIWPALNYARNALVPIALLALGIQLAKTAFDFTNIEVYLASAIRLLGGPVLSIFLIHLLGIEGIIAQVLIISSALPTGVNTALIAIEFDNYPDFASQIVMTSTLFSAGSLVFVIYMARIFFPIA